MQRALRFRPCFDSGGRSLIQCFFSALSDTPNNGITMPLTI